MINPAMVPANHFKTATVQLTIHTRWVLSTEKGATWPSDEEIKQASAKYVKDLLPQELLLMILDESVDVQPTFEESNNDSIK